jgi:hypothetical protein
MDGVTVTQSSQPEEKIQLFRSLFRGRDDVFARRFENRKTGRGGYAPACRNEWIRGICEKPRIKCADCRNRAFIPVGDEEVGAHLTGYDHLGSPFVMGLYPMLTDETCWFLALDLDGEGWMKDAVVLRDVCRRMEAPVALERSRSGNGGHLWIFFDEPLPASLARKLGSSLLTSAMNERPDMGFGSYDRLFPNQDTLPRGGFGNLIALPMQGGARRQGNSVFLDEAFQPIEDQWSFLSSIRRMGRLEVEKSVGRVEREGSVLGVRPVPDDAFALEPWKAPPSRRNELPVTGPLPDQIEFVLADQIYISRIP